jgi:hypothetical protein
MVDGLVSAERAAVRHILRTASQASEPLPRPPEADEKRILLADNDCPGLPGERSSAVAAAVAS